MPFAYLPIQPCDPHHTSGVIIRAFLAQPESWYEPQHEHHTPLSTVLYGLGVLVGPL